MIDSGSSFDELFAQVDDSAMLERPKAGSEGPHPSESVIDGLLEWMGTPDYMDKCEPPRAPGRHASSLWKTCARRRVLDAVWKNNYAAEERKAAGVLTTGLGHAIHHWFQNEWMGPAGVLWGDWECRRCGEVVRGKMPLNCGVCEAYWRDNQLYNELKIKLVVPPVSGHCDGIIEAEDGHKYVFELKSKSTYQYEKLTGPTEDHVWQVRTYMEGLCQAPHNLDIRGAVIVYMDKGKQGSWSKKNGFWSVGSPRVKRYFVSRDPVAWGEIIKVVAQDQAVEMVVAKNPELFDFDTAAEAREYLSTFPRRCDSSRCKLADDCPVSEQCFEMPAMEV